MAGLPAAVAQGPRRVGILFAPAAERQAHSALPRHHPSSTLPPKIFLPLCMDRLPFAREVVLSEVADMYPAC